MDDIVTKALIIGVSIFVTLLVATVLILEFTEIKGLYRGVAETEIRFEDRLDEFDKYRDSNNYFNGLDVKNTIEKYKNDKTVQICEEIDDEGNIDCDVTITSDKYNKQYRARMDETSSKFIIIFKESD